MSSTIAAKQAPAQTQANYEVRKGDSLSKILKDANPGISNSDLKGLVQKTAELNGLKDANKINVGQKLQLPTFKGESTFTQAKAPTQKTETKKEATGGAVQNGSGKTVKPWEGVLQDAKTAKDTKTKQADATQGPQQVKGSNGDVKLNVPWFSQIKGGPKAPGVEQNSTACFNTSVAMAKASGATVLGPDKRIQVATSENAQGRVTVDPKGAAAGRSYIDSELNSGRPVVVGVSHSDKDYNADKITDHFVTITGRGTDEKGRQFYSYLDPATAHQSKSEGRFYVDEKTGNLNAPKTAMGKPYDLAMVRRNAESGTNPKASFSMQPSKTESKPAAKPETKPSTNTSNVGAPTPPRTTSGNWQTDAQNIHDALGVKGPNENLSKDQISKAMDMASKQYGVPKELLEHIAKNESSNKQGADNGAAHGLMQIERVHGDAYKGGVNAGNDTIANIVYAAKTYGKAAQALTSSFEKQGLKPPTGQTLAALTDFVYNRGDGVAPYIAKNAKQQGIDTNNLQEYFAGKGGSADWAKGKGGYSLNMKPGSGVGAHGENSVLQNAVNEIGDPKGFKKSNKKDRSGDGDVDHYDIWIQRAGSLVKP